jgi:hypothetical protein
LKAALRSVVWVALLAAASAGAADVPDLARGRALYENHCLVCHTEKVHTRPRRTAFSVEALRAIVDAWQREENLRWSAQDIDDVVYYLGATRYKF